MVAWMIVLSVLLVVAIAGFIVNTKARLSFLEKEAEVIDFIDEHWDFENRERVTGYQPIVRFEVDGKIYQGPGRIGSIRRTKNNKPTIVLYNPQNPAEFELKEISYGPGTGCIFVIIVLVALGVSVYFYIR